MKQRIIFTLLCLIWSYSLLAQDGYDGLREDIRRAGGVFNLYNFNTPPPAKAPSGYKHFYISHYGRHGSRMSSHSETYETLLKMMTEAHNTKNLTIRGEVFFQKYIPLYPRLRLRGGDLTPRGQYEQNTLARRMYNNYKCVFKDKDTKVIASSTTAPRAIMSMYAFLDGIRGVCPSISISSSASQADVIPLNPFTTTNPDCGATDAGFINPHAAWLDQMDTFRSKMFNPDKFLGKIFKSTKHLKKYGDKYDLEQMFYEICCCVQCMYDTSPMWDVFDFEELCHYWEWNSLKYYLSKGPAPHSNGRQWALVWPTLQDIIDKAETAFKSDTPVVNLRFGHDITIMAMMTLLDIKGWTDAVNDEKAKFYWQEYNVPMASNLQFIFYKNKANDILIRFMLNEVEQELPIKTNYTPYYKWEDFKKFALQRISVAKQILKNTTPPPKKVNVKERKSSLG